MQRRIVELATEYFISSTIFQGRGEGPGHFIYATNESPWTERQPEVVSAGAEYPRTAIAGPDTSIARIAKFGLEAPITDESIGRLLSGAREVDIEFRKMVNTLSDAIDTIGMAVLNVAVANSTPTLAPWNDPATSDPVSDVARARARIRSLKLGYEATHVVCSVMNEANLFSAAKIQGSLAGVNVDTAQQGAGRLTILGLPVLPSINLPEPTKAYLVDVNAFGGMAFERIPSNDWTGDPATGPETRTRRNPDGNDETLIAVRWPIVPYTDHPLASWAVTGLVE